MKIFAFEYMDRDVLRGKRRGASFAALCVGVVAALAMFALLPGEGMPRRVSDKPYDEGAFAYSGLLRDGRFSGQGRIDFADGGRYEGGFAEGRFEGPGLFASADGWSFEGTFSEGRPLHGVFRIDDDEIEADPESGIYAAEGSWQYMGLLGVQGPRGRGVFAFADGSEYRGAFSNGLPGGEGTFTDASGKIIYAGEWQAGLFEGEGEYHDPDGAFSYTGSFAGGRFHGAGTLTQADGTQYAGTWKGGWRTRR